MTPCTSSLGSLLALTGALAGHMQPYQKMDPEHLDAYKRAFDEFDLDGDGKISTQVTLITVKSLDFKFIHLQELQLAFRRV